MADKGVDKELHNVTKRPPLKSSTSGNGIVGILKNIFSWMLNFVSSAFTVTSSFAIIFLLYLNCTSKNCTFFSVPKLPESAKLVNVQVFTCVFIWFGLQAVLAALPIGMLAYGPKQGQEEILSYRLNGIPSLVISFAVLWAVNQYGLFTTDLLEIHHLSFLTATSLFALVLGIITWLAAAKKADDESDTILDGYLYGNTISPRIFSFDIKTYAFKAGSITWCVINLVYFLAAVQDSSSLRNVIETNPSLVLIVGFQTWYIIDLLLYEESLLYTASISSEKFGFMAIFGMVIWAPFFCTLQARYLFMYPITLPWYYYAVVCVIQVVGYFIYRISVQQKFNFRKYQKKMLSEGTEHITTSNNKNLLVDGWWKRLRHPNYFGDLLMNISWAALCGFHHFIGWFWPAFLLPLLVWMCFRDDIRCQAKYGDSWSKYQKRVKYRMIPLVF